MTCDDFSFISTTQKTLKPSKKKVSISRIDEKTSYSGISAEGYRRKRDEMQVDSKKSTGKAAECSKHLTDALFKYL